MNRITRAQQATTTRNVLAFLLVITCVTFPIVVMYNAVFAAAGPTPPKA